VIAPPTGEDLEVEASSPAAHGTAGEAEIQTSLGLGLRGVISHELTQVEAPLKRNGVWP